MVLAVVTSHMVAWADTTVVQTPEPSRASSPENPRARYEPPKLMELQRVAFPPRATAKRLTGEVVIEFVVDGSGAVRDRKVKRSSGQDLMDLAAMVAVKTWSWGPAQSNGIAVSARCEQTVKFAPPTDSEVKKATRNARREEIQYDFQNPPLLILRRPRDVPLKQRVRVELQLELGAEGRVETIQLFKSSGVPECDFVALRSVYQWRFKIGTGPRRFAPGKPYILPLEIGA